MTKRNPDQLSSMAQTLLSTSPAARPKVRTIPSFRSVGMPEFCLYHATQRPPLEASFLAQALKDLCSCFEFATKRTTTSAFDEEGRWRAIVTSLGRPSSSDSK